MEIKPLASSSKGNEIWKDVKGFEGIYQISNLGRLKSFKKHKSGYILSNKNQKGDYLSVILKGNNKVRHTRIHILVVESFIGDIPKGYQVHHIDGNKQNNCVDNLEIVSTRTHHILSVLDNPKLINGMINYNKKIRPKKIYQYSLDGDFIKEYPNAIEASNETGVCSRNILQVANKDEYKPGLVRKQAGGFVWSFEKLDKESEVVVCS